MVSPGARLCKQDADDFDLPHTLAYLKAGSVCGVPGLLCATLTRIGSGGLARLQGLLCIGFSWQIKLSLHTD